MRRALQEGLELAPLLVQEVVFLHRDRWRVGVRFDLGAARLTGCVQGGQVDRCAGASVELTLKLADERGVVVSSEVDDRAALVPVPVLVFAEVNGDADAWFVFIEDDADSASFTAS